MVSIIDEQTAEPIEPSTPVEPTAPVEPPQGPPQTEGPQTEEQAPAEPQPAAPDAGDGDGNGGALDPSHESSPEPETPQVPPPSQIECEKCGHLNLLLPETPVYELPPSSRYETCPECLGGGMIATGSFVAGKARELCTVCKGNGYIDTQNAGNDDGGSPPSLGELRPDSDPPWPGATWDQDAGTWR